MKYAASRNERVVTLALAAAVAGLLAGCAEMGGPPPEPPNRPASEVDLNVKDPNAMSGTLFMLGWPKALTVSYGDVVYGAEPPRRAGKVSGLGFHICGTVPRGEDTIVYGIRRSKTVPPQVWRARTRDGIVYQDAEKLFEVPPSRDRWLQADLALKGERVEYRV